jgi:hypothetical protein
MGTALNNYTSPQSGLLNSPITNIQSNSKGRVSQMLSPVVILGQTTGQATTNNPLAIAFGLSLSTAINPNQVINFTADANQNIVLVLGDGTSVNLTLNYFAGQQGWFYSFNYNDGQFLVNNRRLVTSPNMLSQFKNIIEFGFAVTTSDGYEPIYIDDFVTGRAKFYILESSDVAVIEETVINVA